MVRSWRLVAARPTALRDDHGVWRDRRFDLSGKSIIQILHRYLNDKSPVPHANAHPEHVRMASITEHEPALDAAVCGLDFSVGTIRQLDSELVRREQARPKLPGVMLEIGGEQGDHDLPFEVHAAERGLVLPVFLDDVGIDRFLHPLSVTARGRDENSELRRRPVGSAGCLARSGFRPPAIAPPGSTASKVPRRIAHGSVGVAQ